jgi:voltage-gated potassium channel
VDLLSFLPYYLPVFFPAGAAVFRLFRIVRIFRLFRINAYYDSLNVITEVIVSKKQQLLSSVFIVIVLMLASSLCMYSLEHDAQPEVFRNAFSGIWWSVSTLLTVGYGDIYPITTAGKAFGVVISFLGVLIVAIPTGIISAGFVEQYSRFKRMGDYAQEAELNFISVELGANDPWSGKCIKDLLLPRGALIATVQRGGETIVPRGDVLLRAGDRLIICAEAVKLDQNVNLREVVLGRAHEWTGTAIKDLDISRQTHIVMVRRRGTMLVPHGSMKLMEGDTVILYSKEKPKESRF